MKPAARTFALLCALLVSAGSSALASTPDSGENAVLARVGDEPVTTRDLAQLLASQPRPEDADIPTLTPNGLLERLVENRLLEQEGYRMGAHEAPEVKNLVWDLQRHRGMMALLDSVSAGVREETLARMDSTLSQVNRMHRISHILLDDRTQADALRDSLAAGAAFADLALRHSRDSTAAENGGDLGWAREDLYIPSFREAVTSLQPGEVSAPVESERGWHLLRLEESRTETVGQSDKMAEEMRTKATREAVMEHVQAYVNTLREKHGVMVNEDLAQSLDYASADVDMKARLKNSEEVLVTLPWRTITVKQFSRRLRFDHFHGLEGKEDAHVSRDKLLDEWVTELILRHEASSLGLDRTPDILAAAEALEREQIREKVLNEILDFPFAPSGAQLREYWETHPEQFARPPRFKARGVTFTEQPAADTFRASLDAGADLQWLAARTPQIWNADPPALYDWVTPADLGLPPDAVAVDRPIGPVAVGTEWLVAKVTETEEAGTIPFEECGRTVQAALKRDRMNTAVVEAVRQLKASVDVVVEDDATDIIALWIDEWQGHSTTPARH